MARYFLVRSPEQGLAVINDPAIITNFAKALRWKPQSRTAVLLPCAGTKPFPDAPSHGGYLSALENKDVDLWVVSEPLGVVPYAWSRSWPNADYDFPPRFLRGAAWDAMVERVGRWLDIVGPKYEKVFMALPGHHERLVREALEEHDPGNVRDATHSRCLASGSCPPGHGRSTSTRYRSFLRGAVRNPQGSAFDALEKVVGRIKALSKGLDPKHQRSLGGGSNLVLSTLNDREGREDDEGYLRSLLGVVHVLHTLLHKYGAAAESEGDVENEQFSAVLLTHLDRARDSFGWDDWEEHERKRVKRRYGGEPDDGEEWKQRNGGERATNRPIWLFSYGSNGPSQLSERLGREVKGGLAASLPGWQRVFRGWSERWSGGVASLERAAGARTYGWVAPVSEKDLVKLDDYEGVASGHYRRVRLKVDVDGRQVQAVAYVSMSDEFNAPSRRYLRACAKTVGSFWSEAGREVTAGDFPIA